MKNEKKWIIWQNVDLNIDDYEDYFSDLETEYEEEFSDSRKWEMLYEDNAKQQEDERANLDKALECDILVLANLGLWYGRRGAYKIIESGNIKDCLFDDADYVEWYCDKWNLRCTAHHHDGTNYYLYREIRPDLTETQKENFMEKLYDGSIRNNRTLRRYTRSIRPEIAKVYGWN